MEKRGCVLTCGEFVLGLVEDDDLSPIAAVTQEIEGFFIRAYQVL